MCVLIVLLGFKFEVEIKSLHTMNRGKKHDWIEWNERHFNILSQAGLLLVLFSVYRSNEKERRQKTERTPIKFVTASAAHGSIFYVHRFYNWRPFAKSKSIKKNAHNILPISFLLCVNWKSLRSNWTVPYEETVVSSCLRTAFHKLHFWSRVMDWN